MAGKTVAAVVKLIDSFSDPSKQVVAQAKDLEKRFNKVADVFKNAGEAFTSAGTMLSKTVTAPLVAVGTAAVKFASDSQNAFQQFAAATGTATESMGKYEDMINNVYKHNFGESIEDVASAMATVNQNMSYLNDSALQRCTEYAFTLSDTFGYDVSESVRAADSLISNFGIEANEAFNLIAQGAQNGLDYSGELIDSINEYSPQFKKLGLDAEDMFSIFSTGVENGAFNLDKIGDAVKEFSIRAIDGSDTTKEGFAALGLSVSDMEQRFAAGGDTAKEAFNETIKAIASMENPIKQSEVGVNLFGTMWEDLGPQVVTSLSTSCDAIDMTKESMEALVNTKYDTLSSALGGLWRTIQVDVLQPIGNQLIPYVTKGIDYVQKFVAKWNSLEPATQKMIVKFGAVAAAVGPVFVGFGKVSTGIGNLISDTGKIGGMLTKLSGGAGFKGLAKVMIGPFGIAAAAVAAAAVLIYQNWDKIEPIVQNIKQRFADFAVAAKPLLEPVIEVMQNVASYLSDKFQPIVEEVFAFASERVVGAFDTIDVAIQIMLKAFEKILTFLNTVFTTDWKKVWETCRDFVGEAFSTLAEMVKIPINAVISVVNGAIAKINDIHFTVPEWVPGIGGKGWEGLNIPVIPTLAKGTDNWQGGIVQISEKGGEIVDLPSGTRVYPHDESIQIARKEATNKNVTISIAKLADSIVVREDSDIDRIATTIAKKLEQTMLNMPQMA